MKKQWIILVAILAVPVISGAQNKAIEALAEKYSDREGFTTTVIQGDLISGMQGGIKVHDMNISDLMNNISSIIMISSERQDDEFSGDVKRVIAEGHYSTIMSVSEGGQTIRFLLASASEDPQKKNGPRNEFVMMLLGRDDNMLISIVGNYKVKQISKKEEPKNEGKDKKEDAEHRN